MKASLTWVFDLDNTLHDANRYIFPHISGAMTAYLERYLGLDREAADALRVRYWHRYGTTLTGLMKHHAVDPHHFLWHTHQFPALETLVTAERGLREALWRLPGRKIIFSNSPQHYCAAVLDALGIRALFDAVLTVEHTRFHPKPARYGFYRLFARERVRPSRCVMVEDSLENLKTAKALGMSTVWVRPPSALRHPAYVDVGLPSVLALPRAVARL
ncbi:MAG: pyrimidine 5'-nucleotidase [Betaproteobacteria bacterium]|nr:pyrimidine 5'-nucleotidase [Betaproteobacteria bacterium]